MKTTKKWLMAGIIITVFIFGFLTQSAQAAGTSEQEIAYAEKLISECGGDECNDLKMVVSIRSAYGRAINKYDSSCDDGSMSKEEAQQKISALIEDYIKWADKELILSKGSRIIGTLYTDFDAPTLALAKKCDLAMEYCLKASNTDIEKCKEIIEVKYSCVGGCDPNLMGSNTPSGGETPSNTSGSTSGSGTGGLPILPIAITGLILLVLAGLILFVLKKRNQNKV